MHGLINRSIQNFICDRYGRDIWVAVTGQAGLDFADFEAMLIYDDALTSHIIDAATAVLHRPRGDFLEDIGTYLVCDPAYDGVRRLLRFGGVNFTDFLHSLDDLPDRARLAVSELHLPAIELREYAQGRFSLRTDATMNGFGFVMMGVLRVMADDYGTLAVLEHTGVCNDTEIVSITVIETDFTRGRDFKLGVPA